MDGPRGNPLPEGVDQGRIRSQLAAVLASPGFANSPRVSALLTFLVEETLAGRAAEIKESTVAVRVFGRKPDFDPRFDSVVRAQATQLRHKLREYYTGAGTAGEIRIEVPAGGYVPVFGTPPTAEPKAAPAAAPRGPWPNRRLAALLAVSVVFGAALAWALLRWSGAASELPPSLAILAFEDFSAESDHYRSEGLVEDLTMAMSRVPGLRVAARTSAFHFRGRNEDIRSIGRQLGVAAVLEGSVRRAGERIKVTAQLIDARTGYHIWSNAYEGPEANLPTIERDIALALARALKLEMTWSPIYSHVPSPEAYDLYLQARFRRGGAGQNRAESIPLFERALERDPQFAAAWAALASTHAVMAFHREGDAQAHRSEAHRAAERCLKLDETIPEAHVALATLAYSVERDWPRAEREFRRALALNPSYAYAHRAFALGLLSRGRFAEALAELDLAGQLDPIADAANNERATALYCAGRYEEAIAASRRVLERKPGFYYARVVIGNVHTMRGAWAEADAEYGRVLTAAGRNSYVLSLIGFQRARQGRREDALRLLEEVRRGGDAPLELARIYAGLGENANAIAELERAAAAGAADVEFLRVDPAFAALRAEPAFQALMQRLGL